MKSRKALPPQKNWLEWLVFGLSLAVIAITLGSLVYGFFSLERESARLDVLLGEPREAGGRFLVPVVVENRGARPASAVQVEVLLSVAGQKESAAFELAYSPGGSIRRGEVGFSIDPRTGSLSTRIVGFELP